jgi:hypothetical protein
MHIQNMSLRANHFCRKDLGCSKTFPTSESRINGSARGSIASGNRNRQSESEKADTDSDPDSDAEYLLKILLSKTLCDALDCVLKGHRST